MLALLLAPALLLADAGILIPRDKAQPDPAILSLEEMEITIRIDNGDARVFVKQIFANHTNGIEEGNYIFALPSQAVVSDFAVWDGPVRIPAVVLERKRAEEIYNQLRAAENRSRNFANGRARVGRSQTQFCLQRAHRSHPGLRNQAAGV